MEFISASDLHITNKRPENRKDVDYSKTCFQKFNKLCKAASLTKNKVLVVAGDFFDSPYVPYEVTRTVIKIINQYKIKILVVPGQHDLRYHKKGLKNTPLGVLESAKAVSILSSKKVLKIDGVTFIGGGWEEEPKVNADIFVTHQMVTKEGPLWPGHTDYISAEAALMKKYSWAKCIISGDNHKPHLLEKDERIQINCGSMLRKSKDQVKYKPSYVKVSISSKGVSCKFVPYIIKPVKDVFDFEKIKREETLNKAKEEAVLKSDVSINKFIDSLPKNLADRPDFKSVLQQVVKSRKPTKSVKNLISDIMEKVS